MSTERPTFQTARKVGYDTRGVDRAVDWAVDQLHRGTPVPQSDVDALSFEMVRRGGYEPRRVDEWFDALPEASNPDGVAPGSSPSTLPTDLRRGGIDSPSARSHRLRTQVTFWVVVVGALVGLIVYFVA